MSAGVALVSRIQKKSMTAAVLTERTFLVPEVSSHCIKRQPPFADISIKVESVENGIWTSEAGVLRSSPEVQLQIQNSMLKHQKHHLHKEDLDPKLLQVAQLFVQDLLIRAKIEAHRKSASSENQVFSISV